MNLLDIIFFFVIFFSLMATNVFSQSEREPGSFCAQSSLGVMATNAFSQSELERKWRAIFREIVGCKKDEACANTLTRKNLVAWFVARTKRHNLNASSFKALYEVFNGFAFADYIKDGNINLWGFDEPGTDSYGFDKYTGLVAEKGQDLSDYNLGAQLLGRRKLSEDIGIMEYVDLFLPRLDSFLSGARQVRDEDGFIAFVKSKQDAAVKKPE